MPRIYALGMANIIAVPPSNLLIDAENPRLSTANQGQREAMRALAKHLNRKIVVLAKDIVAFGMDPSNLSIVMPDSDSEGRYYVVEGNRRLIALRALENPDTFVGAL